MNNIIEIIEKLQLTDIFQIGLADINSKTVELIPNHTVIFLEFESSYLKFESINQSSNLRISETDCITFDMLALDEDLPPYKSSVKEFIFIDSDFNNSVTNLDVYGFDENEEDLVCKAISLKLQCSQEIFFDPTFYFGINIGGELQKEKWLDNYPNNIGYKVPIKSFRF